MKGLRGTKRSDAARSNGPERRNTARQGNTRMASDRPTDMLTPEQGRQVEDLSQSLDPPQARWLSGFFAGFGAGLRSTSSPQPASFMRGPLILLGTETGNAGTVRARDTGFPLVALLGRERGWMVGRPHRPRARQVHPLARRGFPWAASRSYDPREWGRGRSSNGWIKGSGALRAGVRLGIASVISRSARASCAR